MRIFTFISLSLLVLISTIGIPFYGHLCSNSDKMSFASLENSHDCLGKKTAEKKTCHGNTTLQEDEKPDCCHDEFQIIQIDANYTSQIEDVSLNLDLLFSISFFYNVIAPFVSIENTKEKADFNYYSPPIPFRDIPVEIQSFLI